MSAESRPGWELRALARVQLASGDGVVQASRALSAFGEHAAGWLGIIACGALLDPARRGQWQRAGVAVVGAHAVSVVLKRVVRRRRPDHSTVRVHVGTPSGLTFPSSHASSSTAAALVLSRLLGVPLVPVVVPAMAWSRLVLGVHHPSDVLAGVALGAVTVAAVHRAEPRWTHHRAAA